MPRPVVLPPLPPDVTMEDLARALLKPVKPLPDKVPVHELTIENGHDEDSHLVDGVQVPKIVAS